MPDTPPPGRRESKRQRTRLALITAALRLADERGLDRVTVDEISAAAEVSPRTFFNYFPTKEDALVADPLEGRDVKADLLAVAPGTPLLDALLEALGPAMRGIQDDRPLWLLRMRVIEANPQLLTQLIAAAACAEQDLTEAVAERTGLPAGHAYPAIAAAVASAALRVALLRWTADPATRPLSDHAREAFGTVAGGLTAPTPDVVTPSEEANG